MPKKVSKPKPVQAQAQRPQQQQQPPGYDWVSLDEFNQLIEVNKKQKAKIIDLERSQESSRKMCTDLDATNKRLKKSIEQRNEQPAQVAIAQKKFERQKELNDGLKQKYNEKVDEVAKQGDTILSLKQLCINAGVWRGGKQSQLEGMETTCLCHEKYEQKLREAREGFEMQKLLVG